MLVDSTLTKAITDTKQAARAIEAAGFDGLWVGETKHEPFLQLLQAAEATERLTIGTAIAIAFARSPMTLANAAYDLAQYSGGRFVLGLGSQIKPHIERRFSMPWSHPAARMRELVLAMRAIWTSWETSDRLDFRGDFYTHTLMTPFFAPEPHPFGPPPVYLAGVGERMTEVAGEVCDGFFFHPFTTERYLAEITLPALLRGRAAGDHGDLDGFALAGPTFACVGRNEEELAAAIKGTKDQIAFYASTPAYRPVLELHGWGDLQPELTRLSKEGRWSDMGDAIDDELLHAFAVVGDPATVGAGLRRRWGPVATRITIYATYPSDPAMWPEVVDAIRSS
ncbi:MAG: putative N5,N10-methylenetetrahydromethanopterin reductase-related protein [Ilumatobacteraceae bacterium]|nr:putative N5,N10-methylenetetrahydromethanopterin reductase-related protein [Ilumatobacteraceae bacterium]